MQTSVWAIILLTTHPHAKAELQLYVIHKNDAKRFLEMGKGYRGQTKYKEAGEAVSLSDKGEFNTKDITTYNTKKASSQS